MEINPREARAGFCWLVGAGAVAVILSFILWKIDGYKDGSDAARAAQLKTLRTAEAQTQSRATDERQFVPLLAKGGQKP